MPQLMDEKTKKEVKRVLGKLPARIDILYFTAENACPACREQLQILEEVVKFSDKIRLEIFDFGKDGPEVTKYGIDKKLIKQKAVLDSWQQ
jgi:peroxiredoxin